MKKSLPGNTGPGLLFYAYIAIRHAPIGDELIFSRRCRNTYAEASAKAQIYADSHSTIFGFAPVLRFRFRVNDRITLHLRNQ